jgi:putative aldouronate transport system permease protein
MTKKTLKKKPHVIITLALLAISLVIVVPILYILAVSLTKDAEIYEFGYRLLPAKPVLDAYRFILTYPKQISSAYLVSIASTTLGTLFGLSLSAPLAYVLTRRDFRYRRGFASYAFFPLIFNGGLVPFYIVITKVLGIQNTILALFVPYGISVWFTFLLRGFMSGLPHEMIEAAKIDGAGEFGIFFKIVLPTNKSGLATIGLFYAFAYWNDWWLPLLFVQKQSLVPIQYYLYQTLDRLDFLLRNLQMGLNVPYESLPNESVRMAVALLAVGPMLFVFPFFQRFFVKGIVVGSLKG